MCGDITAPDGRNGRSHPVLTRFLPTHEGMQNQLEEAANLSALVELRKFSLFLGNRELNPALGYPFQFATGVNKSVNMEALTVQRLN